MIEGVVAGLVANRVGDEAKVTAERVRKKSREDRITEELGPVETEFGDALGANIESRATELDSVALFNIASNWEPIFEDINAYEVAFDSEEAAVDWLVEAILDYELVDVSLDDDEEAELRQLVAEAYADAVEDFRDAVATDEELAHRFQFDIQTELLDQFEAVAEAFERIADQRSYRLYEFPDERDEIVDAVGVDREVEFVPRPDLVPAEPSVDRQLVLGPSGSGKSRVIAERLARLPDDAVEYVLVPEDQMLDTADARALERERFDGDLLLVWEDLHRVDGGREDGVVRNVLRRLDAALDEQGHRFRALLEAQSGRLEDVFGQLPADFENEKSLWYTFEPLWMGELDADGRGLLAERMAAKYEVELGDAARDRLVERTADSESAPVYVEAVFETADDELTEADVAELPEKVAHIWDRQYRHLRKEFDAEWQVLAAMKYLYDLRVPLFSNLVYKVFCEHLDAERERFRTAVESLANRRQWLTVDGDNLISKATRYRVHDTKLEPIGVRARDDADDLSDLLLASVADDVPDDARAAIHFNSGGSYYHWDEYELAADHYEQALAINLQGAKTHNNYALVKRALGDPQAAADHFEQALTIEPDYAEAHNSYALLLKDELGDPPAAADHFEQALTIKPDYAEAHNSYALLLQKELDQPKLAAEHYEEALTVDSENAEVHYNYATLLIERLNQLELAANHLQQALTIDPEFVKAHVNYANILQEELDDIEAAADHYERALKIDPEIAEAHYSYAVLLKNELDDLKTAADHYERALEIWLEGDDQESDSQAVERMPQIVQLFEEVGRSETAVEFCRRGLEVCDQPWVSLGTKKGIRGEQARLSARDDSDRVPELYWYGLDDLREGYPDVATELLTEAWSLRSAVDGDPAADALAAGVWCVYLPDADVAGDPIKRAADADLSDRPIVAALVTTRTSDDPPPTPTEYRSRGISGHYGHEINAWEALLRRT